MTMSLPLDASASRRPAAPHTWARIEDKFFVPVRHAQRLVATLESRLAPAANARSCVSSIYLDSLELDFLRAHVDDRAERVKLRIRRYGACAPDGVAFLETKIKSGQLSRKERFVLDPASLAAIMSGAPLASTADLRDANASLTAADLSRRVARVEDLRRRRLVPRVAVRYERIAFESDELRVTIDRDIEVRSAEAVEAALPHVLVLEVKHRGRRPEWLDARVATMGGVTASFSKYAFAMQRLVAAGASRSP